MIRGLKLLKRDSDETTNRKPLLTLRTQALSLICKSPVMQASNKMVSADAQMGSWVSSS